MNLSAVTCVEDLRQLHKKRVPRAFFDYADRGSYSEQTLRANRADLEAIKLRQRVLIDIAGRTTETVLLGDTISAPLALSPIGLGGLQYADGEIHACRAAQAAGVPYTLSIMSICSMEDVAAAVTKPFWFQLSIMKDRGFVKSLVERAIAVGCDAIVLTVDLPVLAQRHADIKNGMTVPPKWTLGKFFDFASRPAWVMSVMSSERRTFRNLTAESGNGKIESLAAWMAEQFNTSVTWKDVEWVRSIWPGKLLIKGIGDARDAGEVVRIGAQGLVVSNHGGRQLDGGQSTIAMLPEIVDAVGVDLDVLMDGGVRSGQDVIRALALGAKACMIGRAYIHGLGAAGQAGVAKAIELICKEFDVTMGLTGVSRVADIDRGILARMA